MQAAAAVLAGLEANGPPSGAYSVSTVSVTLPTGQARTYQVTCTRDPTQITHWTVSVVPAPGVP